MASATACTSQFYPVTHEQYATEITQRWKVKARGVGFVTKFSVRKAFMDQFPTQTVGSDHHAEWCILTKRLGELNANIVGKIEVIAEYLRDNE